MRTTLLLAAIVISGLGARAASAQTVDVTTESELRGAILVVHPEEAGSAGSTAGPAASAEEPAGPEQTPAKPAWVAAEPVWAAPSS
jgi:hypothetical protein